MRPTLKIMARNPLISLELVGYHFLDRDLLVSLPAASSSDIFLAAYLHRHIYKSCVYCSLPSDVSLVCEFIYDCTLVYYNPYRTTRACATLLLRTADFAWFTGKTRVCFAARVSGFTAAKRTSKPFRKKRETCFYPIQGKSIHICLFSLGKAVPVV